MLKSRHFINGKWNDEGTPLPRFNPSTEDINGWVPYADESLLLNAVESAHKAFESWKRVSRVKRAELFYKLCHQIEYNQTELARLISLETGKNLNESLAEVLEALHMCQWVASQGRQPYGTCLASEIDAKDIYVTRKPKGVVAVITPWNFPFSITFWTSSPAILEGNTVVHKPSELTPAIASRTALLYEEAGFPAGVYNLIQGNIGASLVAAPHVRTILFTGSSEVGRSIRKTCAERFDRNCSTETGSKSATILFNDGNQDLALEVMVASAFKLSGQRCVSSGRLLIQRDIYADFCEKFVEKVKQLVVGDPFENPSPYFGPLISKEQREKVEQFNSMTKNVLLQGKRPDRRGYYLTPHVYQSEWAKERYLTEEVFGPHVALIPFKDLREAIDIYNDTEYGLALGVITDDFRKMRTIRDECNAGMMYMNGGSIGAESHCPFTGQGKSGSGYPSAAGTYQACTDTVSITVNHDSKMKWAQGME